MSAENIRINIQLTPKDATVGALLDALLEKYVEAYNKNHSEQIHRIIVNDCLVYKDSEEEVREWERE